MKKGVRVKLAMFLVGVLAMTLAGSAELTSGITAEAGSIQLNKSSLHMRVGQIKQLKVKGTKKKVTWSVSNKKIVKVTKKGKVTAKKVGNAKVYAKVKGKKLTCKIKVTALRSKTTTTTETAVTAIPGENSIPITTDIPNENQIGELGKIAIPEVTKTPFNAIDEIKVGDTKNTTGAGIGITYTAEKNLLVIKMVNTTKEAKSVSIEVEMLDAKGSIVNDVSSLYPESISYLSAGQTYYAFAQCADSYEVASYAVKAMKVSTVSATEVDCFRDIKVTTKEEVKDGKTIGVTEMTYEYTGEELAKLSGKSVHVYGSVVYYNKENQIVDFFNVRETIKLSSKNNKTTGYVFSMDDTADHYTVVLSGAEYSNAIYEYDG